MKVKLLIDFCGHKEGSIVDAVGPDVDGDCYLMSASGLIVSPNSDQIEIIQPTEAEDSAAVAIERDRIVREIEEVVDITDPDDNSILYRNEVLEIVRGE